jgi:AbrB family looped-hinge helix DNA binding protein
MRTTIDGAGRLVIPKPLRDEAGLHAGAEVEVEVRDGRIEIEAVTVPRRLVKHGGRMVIEAVGDEQPLTDDDVRAILERTRR